MVPSPRTRNATGREEERMASNGQPRRRCAPTTSQAPANITSPPLTKARSSWGGLCHPPQTAAPLAVVPEPVAAVIGPTGHLPATLAERADGAALRCQRQGVDQLREADAPRPSDDAGGHLLRVLQHPGQSTLAEVADPHPSVEPEVAGPAHAAHQPDHFVRDEQLVHDLWAAGPPVGQLFLADRPEAVTLLFCQRQSHSEASGGRTTAFTCRAARNGEVSRGTGMAARSGATHG